MSWKLKSSRKARVIARKNSRAYAENTKCIAHENLLGSTHTETMTHIINFWKELDFTSATSNAFLAFFCTWLGYRISVRWNRDQIEKDQIQEKKNLLRCIGFFVSDCCIAMHEGGENLKKNMPPHRSIPCAGIEYFQIQLMKHMEKDLVVSMATLRAQIEQANQLVPLMIQLFTASPTDSVAPASHPSDLQRYCRETLSRHQDIQNLCLEIARKIDPAIQGI